MPRLHRADDGHYYVRGLLPDGRIGTWQLDLRGVRWLAGQGYGVGKRFPTDLLFRLKREGYATTDGSGPGKVDDDWVREEPLQAAGFNAPRRVHRGSSSKAVMASDWLPLAGQPGEKLRRHGQDARLWPTLLLMLVLLALLLICYRCGLFR